MKSKLGIKKQSMIVKKKDPKRTPGRKTKGLTVLLRVLVV